MHYGYFLDQDDQPLDEVMAVYMPHGRSYTGEQQVELYCHGGYQTIQQIQKQLLQTGLRLAEPGEFTRLAFLNGRIDLTRAEAVAETVAAKTESSHAAARAHLLGAYAEHVGSMRAAVVDCLAEIEAAIDFPEDSPEAGVTGQLQQRLNTLKDQFDRLARSYQGGRIIREGLTVAIAGRPNVGKSSLFNLLLKQNRALVTPVPGTTRDYLAEWIDLEGIPVKLIDTAGLRKTDDQVEQAGMASSEAIISDADLVIWLTDLGTDDWNEAARDDLRNQLADAIMLVGNKLDLCVKPVDNDQLAAAISCLSGEGIGQLTELMADRVWRLLPDLTDGVVVTSARHHLKLTQASSTIAAAQSNLAARAGLEVVAFELRQAVNRIDELTGRIYDEEVLEAIFSRFCIGK